MIFRLNKHITVKYYCIYLKKMYDRDNCWNNIHDIAIQIDYKNKIVKKDRRICLKYCDILKYTYKKWKYLFSQWWLLRQKISGILSKNLTLRAYTLFDRAIVINIQKQSFNCLYMFVSCRFHHFGKYSIVCVQNINGHQEPNVYTYCITDNKWWLCGLILCAFFFLNGLIFKLKQIKISCPLWNEHIRPNKYHFRNIFLQPFAAICQHPRALIKHVTRCTPVYDVQRKLL